MSEVHDGTAYPWVEDFDDVWHLRPSDDEWTVSNDGPNARARCGVAVPSVNVSTHRPSDRLICEACDSATDRKSA
jgi:hypothetical protein